ncbi:MAG: sugar ABC transporter permease [Synergistaceae bacterium]|jgi:D-xylose transport system permease protein|nr:sugar ABC transporter permease [Synergistaceae bacterium]
MTQVKKESANETRPKIKFRIDLRKNMMVVALVVIWAVFTVLSGGSYLTPRNFTNLFRQAVFTAILAIGMLPVIVLGHIDLSVGSIAALSGGVVGMMTTWNAYSLWPAITVAILIGFAVGLWNGFWVAHRGVPAFVVTMASMLVFRAALVGLTNGITISPMPDALKTVGAGFLAGSLGYPIACIGCVTMIFSQWNDRSRKMALSLPVVSSSAEIFRSILAVAVIGLFMYMMASYRGIPNALLIILVLVVIFQYVLNKTVFGRRIYAIGGNSKASQLAGINIKKTTLIVFGINGIIAAIAGIFLSSRLNSASSLAAASSELDAIAACVIGGTSMLGGIGTVTGTMIGALVIQSIQNGMSLLDTPSFWQDIVKGLVLLFAVWFDISRKKK